MALDAMLLEFVGNNWLSLSVGLGALKVVAKMTPTVHDDAVVTLLQNTLNNVRGGGSVLNDGAQDKEK